MAEHPNLTVIDHPLVRHKLSILRSVERPVGDRDHAFSSCRKPVHGRM